MRSATALDRALTLAREGFPVVPIPPGEKGPKILGWPDKATTDEAAVRRLFAGHAPDSNVGVVCGKPHPAGGFLWALDLDNKDGKTGEKNFADWCRNARIQMPVTRTARTPNGGVHIYLRTAEPMPNAKDEGPPHPTPAGPGVEYKGAGGQVVAPGSKFEGNEYRVDIDAPVAEAPAKLVELFRAHKPAFRPLAGAAAVTLDEQESNYARTEYTRWLKEEARPAIEGSGGDGTTVATAAKGSGLGLSEAEVFDLMAEHYNPRCVPPWDLEQLRVKVANGFKYAKNPPGSENLMADFDNAEPQPDAPPPEDNEPDGFSMVADLVGATSQKSVVKRLFHERATGVLYGPSGIGKSFIVIDLCAAVARGIPWHSHRTAKGCTLYIALEGAGGLGKRLAAYCQKHNVAPSELAVAVRTEPLSLTKAEDLDAVLHAAKRLEKRTGLPCRLVVIDTLNRALGSADENDNSAMGRVLNGLQRIADGISGCALAIHHSGKDETRGARGASAIKANVDALLEVTDGAIRVEKTKDDAGVFPMSFVLEEVLLGVDADGDPLRSAVAVAVPMTHKHRLKRPKSDSLCGSALTILEDHPGGIDKAAWIEALRAARYAGREKAAGYRLARDRVEELCSDYPHLAKIDDNGRARALSAEVFEEVQS